MNKKWIVIIAVGFSAKVFSAHAGPHFELGATGGMHMFADDVELGVADAAQMNTPGSMALLGGRAAVVLGRAFGLEAELVYVPTKDRMFEKSASVMAYRASMFYRLRSEKKVRPFVFAGVGSISVTPDKSNLLMEKDSDLTFHGGAGLLLGLSNSWDIRIDAKEVMLPDVNDSGATFDLELTAGATYRFGATSKAPAKPEFDEEALEPPLTVTPEQEKVETQEPVAEKRSEAGAKDSDNDGLVDPIDDCPNEKETKNDFEDDDGCADEVMAGLDGIAFRTASADLTADSLPILQKAAETLKKYPNARVVIEGHTSSEGSRSRNQTLSQARAETVLKYMITQGIAEDRLKAVGYGDTQPKADNDSKDGRARNRRIEFRMVGL